MSPIPIIQCFRIEEYSNSTTLKNGQIILENDLLCFLIETDIEFSNLSKIRLFLTDIPFKITFLKIQNDKFIYTLSQDSLKEYFYRERFDFKDYSKIFKINGVECAFYKLFINYPAGNCDITLKNLDDDTSDVLSYFKINVTSPKLQETEFKEILNYLGEKNTKVWKNTSLLNNQASSIIEINKSLWLLYCCEEFLDIFYKEKHLYSFSFDKITSLIQSQYFTNYDEDVIISDDSLYWLTNNLDVLVPTNSNDLGKIKINNLLVRPTHILTNKLKEETDNSENVFVHGFLKELIYFCLKIEDEYNIAKNILPKVKNLQDEINYFFYEKSINRAKKTKIGLLKIKNYLEEHIPTSRENASIEFIHKINSKAHYLFIYKFYVAWIKYQTAKYSKNKTPFIGIDRMDKLFEIACYYKIIDTFISLGYEQVENTEDYTNEKELYSKIYFKKKSITHILYYETQPDLIRTVKPIKRNGKLNPDFIIELENGNYIIIDAKYKKRENIEKYDLPELALKYLHGLGNEKGGIFNAIALLVLYPNQFSELNFYQKENFNLFSDTPSIPVIGNLSVCFSNEYNYLTKVIEALINL